MRAYWAPHSAPVFTPHLRRNSTVTGEANAS